MHLSVFLDSTERTNTSFLWPEASTDSPASQAVAYPAHTLGYPSCSGLITAIFYLFLYNLSTLRALHFIPSSHKGITVHVENTCVLSSDVSDLF
jgi:hypothetical protein